MKCLAILIVVLFVSLVAVGQDDQQRMDGNELLPQCKAVLRAADSGDNTTDFYIKHNNTEEQFNIAYCLGLVTGVSDMLHLCPSSPYGQRVRVVVKFLEDHPEKLSLRGTMLVRQALMAAFPCGTSTPSPK